MEEASRKHGLPLIHFRERIGAIERPGCLLAPDERGVGREDIEVRSDSRGPAEGAQVVWSVDVVGVEESNEVSARDADACVARCGQAPVWPPEQPD